MTKKDTFQNNYLIFVTLVGGVVTVAALSILSAQSEYLLKQNAINNAARYLEAISEFRSLYTSEVVSAAKKSGLTISHDYENIDGVIPLPATLSMKLGESIGLQQSGAKTSLYSRYPFFWREQDSLEIFSQQFPIDAWEYLNENPEQFFSRFETVDGKLSVRYAVADRMRAACINCHNQHEDTPKDDWEIGDVRGVLEVVLPLDEITVSTEKHFSNILMVVGGLTLFFIAAIAIGLKKMSADKKILAVTNSVLEKNSVALSQALKDAQLASQSKDEFLACMSHEIRTPMNGVLGMLKLLKRTEQNEKQNHYTNVAHFSAKSLLVIINDILDLSKMEAGKLNIEYIPFDIRKVFEDVYTQFDFQAQQKDIELLLTMDIDDGLLVSGDPNRLLQILNNLIGNAIKFTSEGSVTVDVSLLDLECGSYQLSCAITDTGIGVPGDKIGALFDSFSQADTSTTREFGGTGLGLTICKLLVELMNGEIHVASVLDEGSTFTFTIELLAVDVEDDEDDSASVDNQQLREEVLSGKSILLVEDNMINQEITNDFLLDLGMVVDTAEHGGVALGMVKDRMHQPYDLILMDCQMPVMDGYEASKIITTDLPEPLCSIPIIAVTAHAMSDEEEKCLEAGMQGFLTKPLDPDLLEDCLFAWLSKKKNDLQQ